jgi:hypothetical protein
LLIEKTLFPYPGELKKYTGAPSRFLRPFRPKAENGGAKIGEEEASSQKIEALFSRAPL